MDKSILQRVQFNVVPKKAELEGNPKGDLTTVETTIPIFDMRIGLGSYVCFRSNKTSTLGELSYGIVSYITEYRIGIVTKNNTVTSLDPIEAIDYELLLLYNTNDEIEETEE